MNLTRHITIILTIIFVLISAGELHAEKAKIPPKPERKAQALKGLNNYISSVKEKQELTKQEMKVAEQDLDKTKEKLGSIGQRTMASERQLNKIEADLSKLNQEKKSLEQRLQADHTKMGHVILAMQRLERIPTETMIARPKAPIQTAQTAMLLQSALPAIQKDAINISNDLKRLKVVQAEVLEKRNLQKAEYQKMLGHRNELRSLVAHRSKLYKSLESDLANTNKSLSNMAQESENLQQLMAALKKQPVKRYKSSRSDAKLTVTPLPSLGQPQLPAQGFIKTGYKQKDHIGAVSQGIHIQGRDKGLIVAPMGGVIKFASQFKHYGNLVIISHKNNYFSLIAGFDDIDIDVGQSVKAGEAIGSLPLGTSRKGQPTLYYELRHKGKAINPAQKITGLKS